MPATRPTLFNSVGPVGRGGRGGVKKGVGKLMNSGPRRASANGGGGGEGGGDSAGDARGVVGVVKEEGL